VSDLLTIDERALREGFAHRPLAVHHRLIDHPMFTVEAIAALADGLPGDATGRVDGDLPVAWGEADRITRGTDGPPSTIVNSIATTRSRLMLWRIEALPAYRALTDKCIDELQDCVADRWGDLRSRTTRMFVSSPGAVTPAHLDVEHNLLLQIRGTKTLTVGRFTDSESERLEHERWWDNGYRNLEVLPPELATFELRPGTGVYIPMLAPHWTRNGDESSVTLSTFFHTRESERYERVQSFNARLRRLGITPNPPGRSARIDGAKAAAVTAYGVRRRLHLRLQGARRS
jgi:hypothetical protein